MINLINDNISKQVRCLELNDSEAISYEGCDSTCVSVIS